MLHSSISISVIKIIFPGKFPERDLPTTVKKKTITHVMNIFFKLGYYRNFLMMLIRMIFESIKYILHDVSIVIIVH